MLLLFETAAGFALFKVLKEGKLKETDNLYKDFESLDMAEKVVKLKSFSKFENTTDALAAATALTDSKLSKSLKRFLKKNAEGETLAVMDSKLGSIIKEKLGISCTYSSAIMELTRGIRSQLEGLVSGLGAQDLTPMSLGLSHSLSRYKLKFSPDKVDTMIVQAIGLLDDLDKELNTYAMRVREWYGWHFPEMSKILSDNVVYAKVVKLMGTRERAAELDFSAVALEEEVEAELKEAAVISMGTEISEADLLNIMALCDQVLAGARDRDALSHCIQTSFEQVVALAEYRAQLFDYLRSRMSAIAPNLTVLVGELVGARLIAHAGSLLNLAKQPASTVQILGAEKALFRALKTKHETPKYGLIYHASLIGQSQPKFKGKISRVLAAKCSLSIRVDALGEHTDAHVGLEGREKVEARLRQLEGRMLAGESAKPRGKPDIAKYEPERQGGAGAALLTAPAAYNPAADVTATAGKEEKKKKKKRREDAAAAATAENGAAAAAPVAAAAAELGEERQKVKKKKIKIEDGADAAEPSSAPAAAAPVLNGGGPEEVVKRKKKRAAAADGEAPKVKKVKKAKAAEA